MSEPRSGWRNWGDHPIVVIIGLVAAVVSIITFLAVKQNTPSNPIDERAISRFSADNPENKSEPASSPIPTSTPQPVSEISDVSLPTPVAEAVTFTITNELGPTQVSEDVQVYIEGRLVANLMVDRDKPVTSTELEVPQAGRYTYTIIADGYFLNEAGQIFRSQGRGDGVIEVSEHSSFAPTITAH